MLALGHAGLTLAAARAVDRNIDSRLAICLAWGPDILDKPLSRLIPELVNHNTRGFGHTALVALFVLAALLAWTRRPKTAFVLWGCYIGHFLLDRMWREDNHAIFLWPLLGGFPPPVSGTLLAMLTPWNVLGEIAGLALLIRIYRQRSTA
jgi:hypothetical protein